MSLRFDLSVCIRLSATRHQGRGGRSGCSSGGTGRAEQAEVKAGRQEVTGQVNARVESRHRSGRVVRGVDAAIGTAGRREHERPVQGRAGNSEIGAVASSESSRSTFANTSGSSRCTDDETWSPQLARADTPLSSAKQTATASHTNRLIRKTRRTDIVVLSFAEQDESGRVSLLRIQHLL
jgi:hypothetical protein